MESVISDHYMAEALRLARRGLYTTDPNPRVGCVIVKGGEVIGRGWHQFAGQPHAEVNALVDAGSKADGADLYVTLEPCSHVGRTGPCVEAIANSGVARVIAAMEDPDPRVSGRGLRRLKELGIEVHLGPMAGEARALNPGFVHRHETGRPLVTLKMGTSLDGRTATRTGESQWITGEPAREDVHRIRASSSAILTGVGTVLADNPRLDARLEGEEIKQPLKVIADSEGRTPPDAAVFASGGDVLLATAKPIDDPRPPEGVAVRTVVLPNSEGMVDVDSLLRHLGKESCNDLLVESGPILAGSLISAHLVDRLVVYLAPCVLGHEGRSMFVVPGLDYLSDRHKFRIDTTSMVGDDLKIVFSAC